MMIFNLEEIKKAQKHISVLVEELKSGYVKYSTGKTTVPPVGHLDFENPTGNTFIKFGCVIINKFNWHKIYTVKPRFKTL